MGEQIYFDHNAATPLLPEALDAMLPYRKLRDACTYDTGRKAFAQLVKEEEQHESDLVEANKRLQPT